MTLAWVAVWRLDVTRSDVTHCADGRWLALILNFGFRFRYFAFAMPMSMGDCGGVSAGSRAGDWQSVLNYLFEVGAAVSLLNQGQGLLRGLCSR